MGTVSGSVASLWAASLSPLRLLPPSAEVVTTCLLQECSIVFLSIVVSLTPSASSCTSACCLPPASPSPSASFSPPGYAQHHRGCGRCSAEPEEEAQGGAPQLSMPTAALHEGTHRSQCIRHTSFGTQWQGSALSPTRLLSKIHPSKHCNQRPHGKAKNAKKAETVPAAIDTAYESLGCTLTQVHTPQLRSALHNHTPPPIHHSCAGAEDTDRGAVSILGRSASVCKDMCSAVQLQGSAHLAPRIVWAVHRQ